jgi:3-oxoacyl-[acyl-carrier protein] reductase
MGFFDLSGQTAIVTGAATGIGEAIARRLAVAGATVAVGDIDKDGAKRVAASIKGAFALPVDITSEDAVRGAVEVALAQTGRIDILVNNAGIGGKAAPLWEQSLEDWNRIIAINLTGVFLFCRAVVPHMRERGYGRIVSIASIAGKEGNPNMTGYSSTKAAVIAFTKSLGKEVATDGICVNLYDGSHTDAPDRHSGRNCGRCPFPCQSGLLLCHGTVLRRLGRTRDLLIHCAAHSAGTVSRNSGIRPLTGRGTRLSRH